MAKKKGNSKTQLNGLKKNVENYEHKGSKRLNNPPVGLVNTKTEKAEQRKTYSYDPHLSPQLQWAGKIEREKLEISTVSLHVHERIDPKSIIESVRSADGINWEQLNLFNRPINKLSFIKEIQFYQHAKDWANRLVAGDSLLVMNSLIEKEGMAGKVQMIYVDPPYGIKYGSNFQPFVNKKPDTSSDRDEDLTQEPEMIRAFRDTWELGIHSYLSYLRDRLLLSKELLSDSGSVFVQIGEENVHHVKTLLEEIFGPKNFKSIISVRKTTTPRTGNLDSAFYYIIWFSKNFEKCKFRKLYLPKPADEWVRETKGGSWGVIQNCKARPLESGERNRIHLLPKDADVYCLSKLTSAGDSGSPFDFEAFGKKYPAGQGSHWKSHKEGMARLLKAGRIEVRGRPWFIKTHSDHPVKRLGNLFDDTAGKSGETIYVVQTKEEVIERCVLLATDPGDLVFDPTCGSGTTAVVAERFGRRWITCDTSRIAVTLAKQRILTNIFDYYELSQPDEGVDSGFIYKTVPHITLESIANNQAIDPIYNRLYPGIVDTFKELSSVLRQSKIKIQISRGPRDGEVVEIKRDTDFFEWEVPNEFPKDWPEGARAPFDKFWERKIEMQKQIDSVIANAAEYETLYDSPEISKDKMRITGPFTVEAVPAPVVRELGTEFNGPTSLSGPTDWINELRTAGIRLNNKKFLQLGRLEPMQGTKWIHADGETAEKPPQRIVISFGPDFAPLEQRQVELAIQEAEKLKPSPTVIVFAAFQFDPEAAKDIDELEWGGVTILKVQMNADLFTEDLKKKKSGNESFWLVGQPDIEINQIRNGEGRGKYQVRVNGFDYYNTKSGSIESGGANKIAMWLLDTDYDGRSLLPKQVFFPMSGESNGWSKLAKSLKAEIDEDLIEAYRGIESLPFEVGENKKVAIKIIDDRGIESLTIRELR